MFLQQHAVANEQAVLDNRAQIIQNRLDSIRAYSSRRSVGRRAPYRPGAYAPYEEEDEGSACLREVIVGLFAGFFLGFIGLIIM